MSRSSDNATTQIQLFFSILKRTYILGPFLKEYAVALALGSIGGGFVGYVVAMGWGAMGWVALLSTCIGIILVVAFTLSMVPKKA